MANPFWRTGREPEPAPEGEPAPLVGPLKVTVETEERRRAESWSVLATGTDGFGHRYLVRRTVPDGHPFQGLAPLDDGAIAIDRPGLPTRVVRFEDLVKAIVRAVPEEDEG